jgi:hypothetical protein
MGISKELQTSWLSSKFEFKLIINTIVYSGKKKKKKKNREEEVRFNTAMREK